MEEMQRRGLDGTSKSVQQYGPRTDDELWQAVYELTKCKIPRVAVCEGHVAPFEVFADLYFDRVQDVLWIAARGSGKRLALDTFVATPDGWTQIGELEVGNQLFDEQGKICTVQEVHLIEEKPDAYRIKFSDEAEILADAEHLWYTEARVEDKKRYRHRKGGVRTTAEIAETLTVPYTDRNERNHSIPVAKALKLPEANLPVDPYLLGVWFGDGSSFHDPKNNKRIPQSYLRASEDQRLALLQGLMDTDGYIGKNGQASITTKFKELGDGILELLWSLGFKPFWREKWVTPCKSSNAKRYGTKEKYGPYIDISFQAFSDRPVVRMPHKVQWLKDRPKTQSLAEGRRIVAVEPVDPVPMRCLTVDSESGLFLVGKEMIPTHNTSNSGWLHGAKCLWKPGYKTAIAGAIEKQSDRAYGEFKRFVQKVVHMIVDEEPLKKKTEWVHRSETEVLSGSVASVNGPHPHLAQFDELELIKSLEVYDEWLNMSQGDDNYAGQNFLTSTRKRSYGLVQAIVKECEEAIRNGDSPPWDVRISCVWETLANVPECSQKNLDGSLKCGCDKVVKGTQKIDVDGETVTRSRTFASVCGGKAKKSQGHVQLKDAHRRFKSLGRRVWEAQQECLRPSSEGLVHEWWDPALYELPFWHPRPEYGPIFRSWDWGGTNEHSVHWEQLLKFDVYLETDKGTIVVPEGASVTFDEVFHSGGGAYSLGLEIFERTNQWGEHGFEFEVDYDFCDPANPTAKADVKRAAHDGGYTIPRFMSVPVTVELRIDKHVEWGEDGRLFVVGRMCPNLVGEYEEYHWPETKAGMPPPKKPVQVDDHAVDDQSYYLWNLHKLESRGEWRQNEAPASDFSDHRPRTHRQEQETRQQAERTYGSEVPVASSMSPGYARENPYTSRPTVRRHDVPGIKQAPGAGVPR